MAAKTFACGASPQIIVTAEGDLSITGWDQESVEAQVRNEEDLTVDQTGNQLTFFTDASLALKIPFNSLVQVNLVDGCLALSSLQGAASIQSVGGHLTMQGTGPITCSNVSGHVKFANTNGEICIRNVGGNLKGSQASAPVSVTNVGGSIKLLNVILQGRVHAGGNIKVKLPEVAQELEAYAGGNIKLWVPPDAGFELEAHSGAEKVVMQSGSESQRIGNGQYRRTVGAGGPLVKLHAGGNIYILTGGWEEDLVMDEFNVTDAQRRSVSVEIDERIHRRIEEKMRQAEIKANAAARRAEEKVNAAMRKAEQLRPRVEGESWRGTGSFNINWPQPPEEPRDKVTDEERMVILTMLSEKKITAEEANLLLDALNGKFNK